VVGVLVSVAEGDDAAEVVAEVEAGVEAGAEAAVAAQAQTAKALEEAAIPVTAPQALTTQLIARELMEAWAALEHWQS